MHVQTLGLLFAVERLHVSIVSRLPGPREVDPHLVVIRPQIRDLAGELRSIVLEQELRNSALLPNVIQGRHHVFPPQSLSHCDRQTRPCEYIHDR